MRLIDAVRANNAAVAMAAEKWGFALALALVKVKRATADDAAHFVFEELALAGEYAELDGDGQVRFSPEGRFAFVDPAEGPMYEAKREDLKNVEVEYPGFPVAVPAPPEIRPEWLEALAGFVEFAEG